MKAHEMIKLFIYELNYLREDCLNDEDIDMIDTDIKKLRKLADQLAELSNTEY